MQAGPVDGLPLPYGGNFKFAGHSCLLSDAAMNRQSYDWIWKRTGSENLNLKAEPSPSTPNSARCAACVRRAVSSWLPLLCAAAAPRRPITSRTDE